MLFFFKKSPVTINAFVPTEYAFAHEFSQIQRASKFLPQWFKNLPNFDYNTVLQFSDPLELAYKRNVKSCPGIIHSLSSGFVVPMWCDLRLEWDKENYQYFFSDGMSEIIQHPNNQISGFSDNFYILKISSPWIMKSSKQLTVYSLPLTYHLGLNHPIKTIFGTQKSFTKQNILALKNFFFLEQKSDNQKCILNFNTPMLHIVPNEEYYFKLECHIDDKEYSKLKYSSVPPTKFVRRGLKMMEFTRKK